MRKPGVKGGPCLLQDTLHKRRLALAFGCGESDVHVIVMALFAAIVPRARVSAGADLTTPDLLQAEVLHKSDKTSEQGVANATSATGFARLRRRLRLGRKNGAK